MNTTPTRATRKGHGATTASTFLYYGRGAAPADLGVLATLQVGTTTMVIRAVGSDAVLGRFGVAMLFWAAADNTAPAAAPLHSEQAIEATRAELAARRAANPLPTNDQFRALLVETTPPAATEDLTDEVRATEILVGDGIDGNEVVEVQVRMVNTWLAEPNEKIRVLITLRRGGITWKHTYETTDMVRIHRNAFLPLTKAQASAMRQLDWNTTAQTANGRYVRRDLTTNRDVARPCVARLVELGLAAVDSSDRTRTVVATRSGRAWLANHPA